MNTEQFYLKIREFFLTLPVPPAFDPDINAMIRNMAIEKGLGIDEHFDLWTYASTVQELDKEENDFSGLCHPMSGLGLEVCTDTPSRVFLLYQEENLGGKEELEQTIIHSFLKVGDKYHDIYFPEGIENLSKHPLYQDYDGIIFLTAEERDVRLEFTERYFVMYNHLETWLQQHSE